MARYRLTEEALKDLDEIWLFTSATWSVAQADRIIEIIRILHQRMDIENRMK